MQDGKREGHDHGKRPPRPRGTRPARTPSGGSRTSETTEPGPVANLSIQEVRVPRAPEGSDRLVSLLLDILDEASPLPPTHRQDLRRDVLDLWRELTSERSTRQADYIGDPAMLAAYLAYFLPWNVVRLIPVVAGADLGLSAGDRVLDIGSGPLTFPIALWIARPDLRAVPLTFVCMDRVRRVLDIGISALDGLRMRADAPLAWTTEARKGTFPFDFPEAEAGGYAMVAAVNVFNESFWKRGRSTRERTLGERAARLADDLTRPLAAGGRLFVMEPGDPRSGAMISAVRESLLLAGGSVSAPCPHGLSCPMPGVFLGSAFRRDEDQETDVRRLAPVLTAKGRSKAPWCHFALDRSAAPKRLLAFSETAGLPKDRLVASWLLARTAGGQESAPGGTRVDAPTRAGDPGRTVTLVSDAFRLPDGGQGRYACTRTGYALARGPLADLPSGSVAVVSGPLPGPGNERDVKSGAVVVRAFAGQKTTGIPPSGQRPQARPALHQDAGPSRRRNAPAASRPSDRPAPPRQPGAGHREASAHRAGKPKRRSP